MKESVEIAGPEGVDLQQPRMGRSPGKMRRLASGKSTWSKMLQNWELYLFVAPAVLYFLIFHYAPMYGIQIAFKNFIPAKGILNSEWVGFQHFERFFNSYYFGDLLWNTLSLSLYELAIGFPLPIILALAFNEVKNGFFQEKCANGYVCAAFYIGRGHGRNDHYVPQPVIRYAGPSD